jgi:protein-S-isoprenylcysteine O-methyltransferase Ste14
VGDLGSGADVRGQPEPQRPESATHAAVASGGLAAFLIALVIVRVSRPFGDNLVNAALFLMGATVAAIFLMDLAWQKVHRRPTTGLDFGYDDPSIRRSLVKFAGLLASLGFVAALYWLFPEYHGAFYDRYYAMLRITLPVWLLLALPYFFWVDRRMREPRDGYWQMGHLVIGQWTRLDRRVLVQHLLGWLIKGFFLPLMFCFLCNDLGKFLAFDFGRLTSFKDLYDFLFDFLYFIDVGLAALGYVVSLRLTDTHLRSAEPTVLGWIVAIACYEPFWSLFSRQYLAYSTGYSWGTWLWDQPVLYGIWGTTILLLTGVYLWSTVAFGARFSNLTHRGIITSGPYRWTRHPAYIAKNISWWMVSIPFVFRGSAAEALRHCLMLLALGGVYFLRAKTEERHLSQDPAYRQYSGWIDRHGLFRFGRSA